MFFQHVFTCFAFPNAPFVLVLGLLRFCVAKRVFIFSIVISPPKNRHPFSLFFLEVRIWPLAPIHIFSPNKELLWTLLDLAQNEPCARVPEQSFHMCISALGFLMLSFVKLRFWSFFISWASFDQSLSSSIELLQIPAFKSNCYTALAFPQLPP